MVGVEVLRAYRRICLHEVCEITDKVEHLFWQERGAYRAQPHRRMVFQGGSPKIKNLQTTFLPLLETTAASSQW